MKNPARFSKLFRQLLGVTQLRNISAIEQLIMISIILYRGGSTSSVEREQFWTCARAVEEWKAWIMSAPFLNLLSLYFFLQQFFFYQVFCPPESVSAKAIPMRLYGDEGPYFKKRTLMVLSFGSYFPHYANSFLSRFLICADLRLYSRLACWVLTVLFCVYLFHLGAVPSRWLVKSSPLHAGTLDVVIEAVVKDFEHMFFACNWKDLVADVICWI